VELVHRGAKGTVNHFANPIAKTPILTKWTLVAAVGTQLDTSFLSEAMYQRRFILALDKRFRWKVIVHTRYDNGVQKAKALQNAIRHVLLRT